MSAHPQPKSELSHGQGTFPGDGAMVSRINAFDWSSTPFGPIETWPLSLKTAVRIMLSSRYAMWMAWGPELTFFCNDAYLPTLGIKQDWALGTSARKVWEEIWPDIGPRIESVLASGKATWDEGLLLFLERSGFAEETYHTFSYSPLADDYGEVTGMLCVVTEETERLIGERRLALLKDLASNLAPFYTETEVYGAIENSLKSNQRDLPFALLYLFNTKGTRATLVSNSGLEGHHPLCPRHLDAKTDTIWPAHRIQQEAVPQLIKHLDGYTLPSGHWDVPPTQVLVTPISQQGQHKPAGFLVVGLNPYRPVDSEYNAFIGLLVGQIAASIASARAFEEARERAEALAELDKAKTTFFSNVSHEFRTPLTLMLGPIEDALADSDMSPASRERMELLHRNGLRLLKLVNTLLDFSRIEAGRVRAAYEPVDLAARTADLASSFRAAMEKAKLEFNVDCRTLSEPAYIDTDMWEKIVLNLLSNAFKYTLQGSVSLSLKQSGRDVVLTVQDTGIGIPAHELPFLFERFHRVEGAQGRTHEGTGIGLALVRELLQLHGGSVSVESRQGKGSVFTATIPLGKDHLPADHIRASRNETSTSLKADAFVEEALRWLPNQAPSSGSKVSGPDFISAIPQPTAGARIVLADDNADMREYVKRLLEGQYRVEALSDGVEAIEAIERELPALVLTDIMMPRLDGFGLLGRLRAGERTRHIPVIMISARAGEEASVEGMNAGADDYLVKPFSARELLARVNAAIRLSEVRNESERTLRDAKNKAEMASIAKSEFLANMSHEIRTPMNAVMGLSTILAESSPLTPRQKEFIHTLQLSADSLLALINDLLDISKIEARGVELESIPFSVARMAEEIAAMMAVRAREKGLSFEVVSQCDCVHKRDFLGDPARLRQIMLNLCSNAVKFTEKGGVIVVIECAPTRDKDIEEIILSVKDTGIGIAPDKIGAIFEKFVQADSSINRKFGGTGLGLAISKTLTDIMGGTITVESEPGKGSTFKISLPLKVVEKAAASPESPSADADPVSEDGPPAQGPCVLLVEDYAPNVMVAGTFLEYFGYSYEVATTGTEAIEKIKRNPYAAVLMDVQMHGMNGFEATQHIREHEQQHHKEPVPIIGMTAHALAGDRTKCLQAGMNDYLPKPFNPDTLKEKLSRLVQREA